MSYARQLLDTYPRDVNVDAGVLAATIDALNDCAQACTADADDDLSEQDVAELVTCIRLCLDCADVCTATLRVASRQTDDAANVTRPLLEACVAACESCGDECERHARMHEHCRVCAEACRRCEQACDKLFTPEVVLRGDRGAVPAGGLREIRGATAVAKQALTFQRFARFAQLALVNGAAGVVTAPDGQPMAVMGFTITHGKIVEIDILADPERLRRLDLAVLNN